MLNIHELERAWLRYKIKSYVPLLIATSLTTVLVIFGAIYWPQLIKEKKEITKVKPVEQIISEAPQTVKPAVSSAPSAVITPVSIEENNSAVSVAATQPEPVKVVVQESPAPTLILQPSLDFIYEIEEDMTTSDYQQESYQEPVAPVVNAVPVPQQPKTHPPVQTAAKPVITEVIEETVVKAQTRPETKISIITKDDEDDLNDVIKRFKQNKNPALSLFVAKRYYSIGAYQKAYNYALMTNDIDSEIEESWLIFAKSLVKLDQKEMAVKTLSSYLDKTESTKAKHLLEEITQGSFQ